MLFSPEGHPSIGRGRLSLETYTALDHLLVSYVGDAHGIVDRSLVRLAEPGVWPVVMISSR